MDVQRLLDAAADYLASGDYRACHGVCIEAIKVNPRLAEPYYLLGILAADHKNFAKALELFERALEFSPGDARFHAQKAKCLTSLNRQEEASVAADEACTAKPRDALTLDTIGVVLSRVGRHQDAVEYFRLAADLDPSNASYQYNLGSALQFSGDFIRAREALEQSIKLNSDNYKVYTALASLRKQTTDNNHIDKMERLFAVSNDPDERLYLGHALAKSYEDLHDYPKALKWLMRGKQKKREVLGYRFSDHEKIFHAAEKLVPLPTSTEPLSESTNPIFVVGMPRTGTTLVDRILSSHSSVISIGELTNFGLIIKNEAQTPSPYVLDAETLKKIPQLNLSQIGRKYIESTRRLRGNAAFFLDKMPLNFFYAPAILAAMPAARVVVLRRSPMDTCLSNFRQLFRTSHSYYNYAFDLADTAKFYARFDYLIAKWRKALPPSRFFEIQYEDLIKNQTRETRRLIAFCGLNWENACLNFHENASPVATASSVQVRNPIYATSMGRWRKYGDALSGLQDALRREGVEPK